MYSVRSVARARLGQRQTCKRPAVARELERAVSCVQRATASMSELPHRRRADRCARSPSVARHDPQRTTATPEQLVAPTAASSTSTSRDSTAATTVAALSTREADRGRATVQAAARPDQEPAEDCDVSASVTSHRKDSQDVRSSSSPSSHPTGRTTMPKPESRGRARPPSGASAELGAQRQQEAGVRDGGEQAEEHAQRRIAPVGTFAERRRRSGRRRSGRPGRLRNPRAGSLREQQPGRDRDEHDLDVAEHRSRAPRPRGDRVVPEDRGRAAKKAPAIHASSRERGPREP